METYVKIRCSKQQRQDWQKAAGLATVSTWARDVLDRAATSSTPPPRPWPREIKERGVLRTPGEAARVAEQLRQAGQGMCRHGLINCRVCQTGMFSA